WFSGMRESPVIFDISSDEEVEWDEEKAGWLAELLVDDKIEVLDGVDGVMVVSEDSGSLAKKKKGYDHLDEDICSISDELDDDCMILDGDPDKPVEIVNDNGNGSDELSIVGEKGQLACRDYPHPRHLCATFSFGTTAHEKYCHLCHCYVCDSPAPCSYWGTGIYEFDHCHSTDKEELWRAERKSFKLAKFELPLVQILPETTISMAPLQHKAGPSVHTHSHTLVSNALHACSSTTSSGVPNIISPSNNQRSLANFIHRDKDGGVTLGRHSTLSHQNFKRVGTPVATALVRNRSGHTASTVTTQVHRPQTQMISLPHTQRIPLPHTQRIPLPQEQRIPQPHAQRIPLPYAQRNPLPHAQRIPLPHAQRIPLPHAHRIPLPDAQKNPPTHAQRIPLPHAQRNTLPQTQNYPPPQAQRNPLPQVQMSPLQQAQKNPLLQAQSNPLPQAPTTPLLQAQGNPLLQSSKNPLPYSEKNPPLPHSMDLPSSAVSFQPQVPNDPISQTKVKHCNLHQNLAPNATNSNVLDVGFDWQGLTPETEGSLLPNVQTSSVSRYTDPILSGFDWDSLLCFEEHQFNLGSAKEMEPSKLNIDLFGPDMVDPDRLLFDFERY
ncbi:hypothetical protein GIB67_024619, partial [Kingdonia uniflora]